jgi:predicted O-methyltransferase YrrM
MTLQETEAVVEEIIPRLPGWCTTEKGKRMAALAYGSELCVELGVFGGRSLMAIAAALNDQGFGRVDGIDPYTKEAALEGVNDQANDEWWSSLPYEEIAQRTEQVFTYLSSVGRVRLIRKRSADAVGDYEDRSIDLLHQDSNHSELVSCQEVDLWMPKMKPGSLWVFDDTNWPTTQAAQGMLCVRGYVLAEDYGAWRVFRAPLEPQKEGRGSDECEGC